MIVAYLSAESEKTQAPAKVPEAWDVAMRGVAARRKHLTYAVDALEKAQWWGVEAVRCHYRRHRACALSMSTAANRLRWLDRECALIGKLRAFLRQRREMAPDSIHQDLRGLARRRRSASSSRLRMDAESEDALRALEATTVLKQKQEHLHEGAFVQLRAALEDLHKREESRLERQIAFRGDEQGLEREKLVDIQAVLRNPPKIHGHFDREKWLDAAAFLEVNAGVLAEKRADHARREEALEKLEGTLAEFTREMGAEEKEAHDRLARAAKAEFDATESEEEDKRPC
ncbi:hypothetical protein JL720_4538 [Aureococcus anophagefferens]|nr:hypothetical protein JL720_4538 [Aureococcus anophagefferens]